MTTGNDPPAERTAPVNGGKADWSIGLRKLYQEVLSEPLPDAFSELLQKLDEKQNGN